MKQSIINESCSLNLSINEVEKSIYLHDFQSEFQGKGNFKTFLSELIPVLKEKYPGFLIYADCNPQGLAVSLKSGAKIVDSFTRVEF